MAYRIEHAKTDEQQEKERSFTGLGLTSRKNLCLHPSVCVIYHLQGIRLIFFWSRSAKRRKAAPWMQDAVTSPALLPAKKAELTPVPFPSVTGTRCAFRGLLEDKYSHPFGQGLNDLEPGHLVSSGIWTLADIMERGKASKTCPYFTIRRMVVSRFFQAPSPNAPILDAVCRRHYLLVPLPIRSKGGRTSLKRIVKRRDCRIRRGTQYRYGSIDMWLTVYSHIIIFL
jgi:DEAD_2